MSPKFHLNELVEVLAHGRRIVGNIRVRSYGTGTRMIEPEYGILPYGEMSAIHMIMIGESKIRSIKA